MFKYTQFILMIFAATAGSLAQESSTNSPFSSGLQIESRTDEQRIEFLLNLAHAYFTEKDYNAAISVYERILKLDPDHKQARFIIGHAYISAKDYRKAEQQLQSLTEDYPEDFQVFNNLAWLYATAEDLSFRDGEKAVKIAHKAMVLAPNDHHVWSTLAEAHFVTGEYEKAYRAITHMAWLASKYGQNVTEEQVDGYNEQIRKCKRAWDAQKLLDENADDA